ncbi:uncharacterized protein LOC123522651 [Echinops telfairi]|uniref:Uncharacterized protein LOC123522651 n=1 Tax=Echinops telfairi TaxID=9371 RepID=A0AC55DS47_ECHTE|nr:uncharacterized protein LOC123522651 [Echinops telfairi]
MNDSYEENVKLQVSGEGPLKMKETLGSPRGSARAGHLDSWLLGVLPGARAQCTRLRTQAHPRTRARSPPLPGAFVWRVPGLGVWTSGCVWGLQTNFREFLPLLCVSPHVTSPAVAEAAAAAAAPPGIGLEPESRSRPRSRSAPLSRQPEEPGPRRRRQAGGARAGLPGTSLVPERLLPGACTPVNPGERRRRVLPEPGHAAVATTELGAAVAPPVWRSTMPQPL